MIGDNIDIKTAFWDYSTLLSNKIVLIILSLISFPIITRLLGANNYGRYSLVLLFVSLFSCILIDWTNSAVLRFGKEEFIKTKKLNQVFWARNIFLLTGLVISLVILLIFKRAINNYVGLHNNIVIFLMIGILFLNVFSEYIQAIFKSTSQLKVLAFYETSNKSMFIIFIIVLLCVFPLRKEYVTALLAVNLAALILTFIYFLRFVNKKWFFPILIDKKLVKEIFFYSFPLIFSGITAYIINYVDLVVINKYMSIESVGLYSLSYKIMAFLKTIPMILVTVVTPLLIGFYASKREDIIVKYYKYVLPIGIFFWSMCLMFIIIIMPIILPVVFGREFTNSTYSTQILLSTLVVMGIAYFCNSILVVYKRIKETVLVNVMVSLLNVAGDFILVPRIGIEGAAISTAISFSIGSICYYIISGRLLRSYNFTALFFIFPVVFVVLLRFIHLSNWLGIIIIMGFYYLILKYFKMFKQENKQIIEKINMPSYIKVKILQLYTVLGKI